MTNKEECTDCAHFVLEQKSVTVDVTGTDLVARARYTCDKGLEPKRPCDHYNRALIEDAITWVRGGVDKED